MSTIKSGTVTSSTVKRLTDFSLSSQQLSDSDRIWITPRGGALSVFYGTDTDPTTTYGHRLPEGETTELQGPFAGARMIAEGDNVNVTLELKSDLALSSSTDFVHSALGHPRFASTDYTFSADQTFVDTSSAEPTRAKQDSGGVLVSSGEQACIVHTGTGATEGYHQLKVGVDVPADGTLTVTLEKNDTEIVSYIVEGGDGGPNPGSSTDYTVITPEFQVGAGDSIELTLAYTHTSPSGQSTQMLIDFSEVVMQGQATAVTGTLLWSWEYGDVSKATYDAFVAPANTSTNFTTEANGRITADDNSQRLDLVTFPHRMTFPISYEVPDMESDGKIKAFSESNNTKAHSLLRIDNAGEFTSKWYFAPRVTYRLELEFEIAAQGTSDWANLDWCIPFQMYPGDNWPAGHSQVAPLNFYIRNSSGGRFQLQLLGNTGDPTTQSYDYDTDFFWPFSTGFHRVDCTWYTDPTSIGDGPSLSFKMDRVTKVDTNVPQGYMRSSVNTTDAWQFCQWGVYSSVKTDGVSPGPSITFHSVKMYRED